jgi:hypothetical protein
MTSFSELLLRSKQDIESVSDHAVSFECSMFVRPRRFGSAPAMTALAPINSRAGNASPGIGKHDQPAHSSNRDLRANTMTPQ